MTSNKKATGDKLSAKEIVEASIAHSPRTMAKLGHSIFPKEAGDRKDIVGEEKDRGE